MIGCIVDQLAAIQRRPCRLEPRPDLRQKLTFDLVGRPTGNGGLLESHGDGLRVGLTRRESPLGDLPYGIAGDLIC